MNCATHPEVAAVAYCRACGKALCESCRQEWQGVVYCNACLPAQQAAAPAVAAAPPPPAFAADGPSPGLAFALGLIPGVGAIYNGQYAKGIIHVIVVGLLISIADSRAAGDFEPLIGFFIAGWWFYMAFEAYHTAKRRRLGEPVDEFSGLMRVGGQAGAVPVGPIALIILGVIFLLNTLGYWSLERVLRYWPVLLILLGIYLLYARLSARSDPGGPSSETGG
jgi:hypothetical protein